MSSMLPSCATGDFICNESLRSCCSVGRADYSKLDILMSLAGSTLEVALGGIEIWTALCFATSISRRMASRSVLEGGV